MASTTTTVSSNVRGTDDAKMLQRKRIVRALAITEVVMGCVTFVVGIAATAIAVRDSGRHYSLSGYGFYYRYMPHAGEGIWSAAVMIIAGGLGIGAGKPNSSKCMVSAHMGMSIVAAVFSGVLVITDASIAPASYRAPASYIILLIVIAILAFVNLVLFITSAAYCCKIERCCYGCCSLGDAVPSQRVIYVANTTGQAQFVQLPNGQQVPIVMQQSGMPTTSGLQQPGMVMMQQPAIVAQQYAMSQPALVVQNPSSSQQQQAAFASQNPNYPEKQGFQNVGMNYGMPMQQQQQQQQQQLMNYAAGAQPQQQGQQQQPPNYTFEQA